MAQGLDSVTDMVIQAIFPWCVTPELYAARPEYVDALAEFVRGRPMPPVDAFMRFACPLTEGIDRWLRSGGNGPSGVNQPVRGNRATVGQELARVVEEDDAVAQQAPPLLGMEGDDPGRVTVRAVSWRTWGLMWAHFSPLGIAEVSGGRGSASCNP